MTAIRAVGQNTDAPTAEDAIQILASCETNQLNGTRELISRREKSPDAGPKFSLLGAMCS